MAKAHLTTFGEGEREGHRTEKNVNWEGGEQLWWRKTYTERGGHRTYFAESIWVGTLHNIERMKVVWWLAGWVAGWLSE